MSWPCSVFPLASLSWPLARSTVPSRLAVSWLAGQDHETGWVTRPRDMCGPVYSRQNELRSRWEKYNMSCRSNCTCYEKTSLMAFAAWTPACLVGSAQRWLVLWSTAAVLVPSRFRYCCTALWSLSTSDWCCASRLSACHVPGAACFVSFSTGLPLDITTNCNNWLMVTCCCILLLNLFV